MMDNDGGKKPKYEPPTVVPLGELARGSGQAGCEAGSGNVECVTGNAAVTSCNAGSSGTATFSDIRLKKDIQDINVGLSFIKTLRPVKYRMKQGNDRIDFGFIAQDVETLLGTGHNILGIGGDTDRTLSLRYTDFIAPMVKAMQEQQAIIDAQKEQIQSQTMRINDLEERLAWIEANEREAEKVLL